MKKYEHLIQTGIEQPLSAVSFHHDAPLTRYVMLQKEEVEGDGGLKIVVHVIKDLPATIPPYADLHKHDFDEINLILSEDNSLKYKVQLDDEVYEAISPSTIYIPKGVRHSAEVLSGHGMYITILFTKEYKAQK